MIKNIKKKQVLFSSKKKNRSKVICAMSGGIDSSVAAALLKKAGFEVIGVFMKFWSESRKEINIENRYCSLDAEIRARKVAQILNIPFYVFSFEKQFKKKIVDYFLDGYKKGITPNPCVACNKEIKFGLLLEKTLSLGVDFIATGHYVRLQKEIQNSKSGILKLYKAKDKNKDQSYFLWTLTQKQLKRILFPIGDYTKTEIRNIAKKFKFPVLDTPESMEICFIQTTINDFLKRHIKSKPGLIFTTEGKKIGIHQGLPFYTIGQRKGIELGGGPFYVVNKDLKKNALIVTTFNNKELFKKKLIAENINWISDKSPYLPLKIKAQIRYGHKATPAVITRKLKGKQVEVIFKTSQRAITPGQTIVFYKNKEMLGGGIIVKAK